MDISVVYMGRFVINWLFNGAHAIELKICIYVVPQLEFKGKIH